jgi:signal peptidase I
VIRRCLEVAVLLIVTVLVTRAFITEAYIVPTGSMAPALAGNHKSCQCPCCGYPIMIGAPPPRSPLRRADGLGPSETRAPAERDAAAHYQLARCPNCGFGQLNLDQVPECPGDRLLVHKHIYELRSPRRWEMVVFSPHVEKRTLGDTYIKRVVGLPRECVLIRDGDVYIDGEIARKTLAEIREMRLPVFDNDYLPADGDSQLRWHGIGRESQWRTEDDGRSFVRPVSADDSTAGAETLRAKYDWLAYRHLVREDRSGKTRWVEDDIKDELAYNCGQAGERAVHDFLLDAELICDGVGELAICLTDGIDDVLVQIPVGGAGTASVSVAASRDRGAGPASERPVAIAEIVCQVAAERPIHIEAGLIDRRVLVAVNGIELFHDLDLPGSVPPPARAGLRQTLAFGGSGPISLGVRGISAQARHLQLFRDIHYSTGDGHTDYPNAVSKPLQLEEGEYFMLGDNTTNSYDSRCWSDPVVRQENLVGKAFLVHMPTRLLQWHQFGEKCALAVPDWSRIKLLR